MNLNVFAKPLAKEQNNAISVEQHIDHGHARLRAELLRRRQDQKQQTHLG